MKIYDADDNKNNNYFQKHNISGCRLFENK